MSSELQFNASVHENVREKSYARYNYYHCDKCGMNVSMKELSQHVATKHRELRFDDDRSSDTDDDLDGMDNGLGRNIKSKKQPTKYTKVAQNTIGQKQRAIAPALADAAVTQTSGDETDFLPFHPDLTSLKNGLFDDDGIVATSTPNGTLHNARSRARSPAGRRSANNWQTTKSFYNRSAMDHFGNDTEMAQNRQRKIPTAHELFDYSKSSEFRTQKVVVGDGEGGTFGGARRYGSTFKRRSVPVKYTPVIPENFEACQYCSNVMHQDYVRAHIERKHRHILDAANKSLVDAEIIGINSIANKPNNVGSGTGNGMAVGDGAGVGSNIIGKIKKSSEPIFVRCKYCSAHMHIHYMPLHLVRKHSTEYDGSVGFCWIQCNDDQVNKLINANRVCVKNGAFYINDLE